MKITKETLTNMTLVQELIDITNQIREACVYECWSQGISTNKKIEEYKLLETYAYTLAIQKASTAEELEKCATAIEESSVYYPNADEWADQIRILAYGFEWYFEKQLSLPAYNELKDFLKENNLENTFEEIEIIGG